MILESRRHALRALGSSYVSPSRRKDTSQTAGMPMARGKGCCELIATRPGWRRSPASGNHDDMGRLAPDLIGPVGLELARAEEQLPEPQGMPGGSRFELKWDGFFH